MKNSTFTQLLVRDIDFNLFIKNKLKYIFPIIFCICCDNNISGPTNTGGSEYSRLSWAAKYSSISEWDSELEEYIYTYDVLCFYVDTSNQCSRISAFLNTNDLTLDTTIYRKWSQISLPSNQTDLNSLTIELISSSGLVNPYPGIEYYEYLED